MVTLLSKSFNERQYRSRGCSKFRSFLIRRQCCTRTMNNRFVYACCLTALIAVFGLFVHFQDQIDQLNIAKKQMEHALGRSEYNIKERSLGHHNKWIKKPFGHSKKSRTVPFDAVDDKVVYYNRVPKTGSTSFANLAYDLCGTLKYHVLHVNTTKNAAVMSLADQRRLVENITTWSTIKPALYHGHTAFINFEKFGSRNPIYINVIRKPLDRLVSYYYFLRFGDDFRPHLKRRKMGDQMTFDECVSQKNKDCDPDHMWLQIPFFCGMEAECWNVGSEWALQRAKDNLVRHYFLVGVTEQLHDMVAVLETALPRFFKGARERFLTGDKSHLRKTANKKPPSDETVSVIQSSRVWQLEDDFYQFALQQFEFIKRKTLPPDAHVLLDNSVNFHYEKIRPKRL